MMLRCITIFTLLFSGCASWQSPSDTSIEVQFGYYDRYSSKTALYARCMRSSVPSIEHRVQLTESQLHTLGEIAVRTGFFSLPARLPYADDWGVRVTSSCAAYALSVHYADRTNSVQWQCDTAENGAIPIQVLELYEATRQALAPAIKDLPPTDCPRFR